MIIGVWHVGFMHEVDYPLALFANYLCAIELGQSKSTGCLMQTVSSVHMSLCCRFHLPVRSPYDI